MPSKPVSVGVGLNNERLSYKTVPRKKKRGKRLDVPEQEFAMSENESLRNTIIGYSQDGYNERIIDYLLDFDAVLWVDWRTEHVEWFDAAVAEGRILGEMVTIDWIRDSAKSSNNFTALKFWGEWQYGIGGDSIADEAADGLEFIQIITDNGVDDEKE